MVNPSRRLVGSLAERAPLHADAFKQSLARPRYCREEHKAYQRLRRTGGNG